MNLRQLRYFRAAVEQRNFTRAAERMHVAQPALGQHIRALEEELQVTLLKRHSRGVDPTPAGQLLYTRSAEVFDMLERIRKEVIALERRQRPAISFGLTTSLTLLIGADLQLAAARDHQQLTLSLREDPSFLLVDAVERQELDVALAYDIDPRPGLSITAALKEAHLFVTHPDQAPAQESVTLEQILDFDLAMGTERDIGRRALARAVGVAPVDLPIRYEVQSIAAIRELLMRGSAASVLPYGTVARELAQGTLAARRIVGCDLESTLYVVRRSHSATIKEDRPLVELALDMVLARLDGLAWRLE